MKQKLKLIKKYLQKDSLRKPDSSGLMDWPVCQTLLEGNGAVYASWCYGYGCFTCI